MEPMLGSVMQYTPGAPGWIAILTDGESRWQEPVVGWATVVIWTAYNDEDPEQDEKTKGTKQFQTEVQPMTLSSDGQLEVPLFREGVDLLTLAMPGQVILVTD